MLYRKLTKQYVITYIYAQKERLFYFYLKSVEHRMLSFLRDYKRPTIERRGVAHNDRDRSCVLTHKPVQQLQGKPTEISHFHLGDHQFLIIRSVGEP